VVDQKVSIRKSNAPSDNQKRDKRNQVQNTIHEIALEAIFKIRVERGG
jgi:hypothetical protein